MINRAVDKWQTILAVLFLVNQAAGCNMGVPSYHQRLFPPPLTPLEEQAAAPREDYKSDRIHLGDAASALSVEQAVMLCLQNNTDLQVQQLGPVIAGSFSRLERGVFDPKISAAAAYEHSDDYGGDSSAVETEKTSAVSGSLGRKLATGTDIAVTVGHQHIAGDNEEEQAEIGISVTQALLRGFGSEVNLARVRQADLKSIASLYELRGFAEAVVADTEIAYWQYVLAREKIAIYTKSYEVVKKAREEIELRIQVGILPEMEAAAVQAEEASRVQALVDARSQLETRRLQLLRLISPLGDGYDLQLNSISEPTLAPLPVNDMEDRLRLAEQNRADLNEARLRLRQNRLETLVTRNGLLPRLDLFVRFGKTGYSDSFGEAWRNLDGDSYDFSAGLSLSHFLGNRQERAIDLAARATQSQTMKAVSNLRQLIRLDVRLAVNEVERSRQLIDASKATRTYQEATLRAEVERFDVGASTAIMVAQAQRDLLQSQIAEVEAIINYRIGLIKLYLAEGSLLERRGIAVLAAH